MRLDKFLKVSRIVKRRTVAKEIADQGRILINGRPAKSSSQLEVGDRLQINFGNKRVEVEVQALKDSTKKEHAQEMYQLIDEVFVDDEPAGQ